jgi:hypothetical protein
VLWLIAGLFLMLVVGPALLTVTRVERHGDDPAADPPAESRGRRLPLALRLAPFVLGVVVILMSTVTTVGTKDVGVVTTFGRPTGRDLDNGLHFKLPWQKVTELDGAINPDSYTGITVSTFA